MSFRVIPVPAYGCEDVAVATHGSDEGAVFTGTEDGTIWHIHDDGRQVDRVAFTGGRPLGIEYDGDGRLVVCDATRGLLRVDPGSGEVEIVMEGLAFANGVALAADESFVAVAESSTRRIARHWITGDRAGERDFLVEDLPGYPDNIARGSDGLVWVAIGSPKDPVIEALMKGPPWLRRQVTKVPEMLQPAPKKRVWTQAYDAAGVLVRNCDVETREFHMVTGVREHAGRVWMGSLHERGVAVLDL